MSRCRYCEQFTPPYLDECVHCGAAGVHESAECEKCGTDISHDTMAISVGTCVNCYAEEPSSGGFDYDFDDLDDDVPF